MSVADQMEVSLDEATPLHSQIQWALMRLIDLGELEGNMPSPGQLAREMRVCTGSIRRAYRDLLEAGVLVQHHLGFAVADLG